MASIDDVIDLQITVTDKAASKPGFGVPLILGHHIAWISDRVREYSDADEMLDDGFSASHYLYKAASAMMSQEPRPSRFKIGRRATALTQTIHLIPTVTTEGAVYSGTIGGQTFSYTVGAAATVQIIVEALAPTLDAFTLVTVTEDNTKLVVAAATAGNVVDISVSDNFRVLDATADTTTDDELAAIIDEDDDWYGLGVADSQSEATILLQAAFTEARTKITVFQSADWDIADAGQTTDVATLLVALAYTRSAGLFHNTIGGTEWAALAWMAKQLTVDPGADTWAFKTLAGISADALKGAQKTAIANKRFSTYTARSGTNVTYEGRTPSARFIDVTRFVDWQDAEIDADVFSLLINNPKLPYDDNGISAIKGAILGSLKKGQAAGGLADTPTPVVTAPTVAETEVSDRANRILRDVNFTARLSGALHAIVIRGTVSV